MRFPLSLLQFLFILSLFFPNPTSAKCLQDQKSSLLALFTSVKNPSWTPNTDCCTWYGITCDGSTGHVIGLDLTNRSISGPINSTAFISLTSLLTLNLSLNLFNTSIPTGLGSLSNLTHLNLSNSDFTGTVPVEISHLKSLVSLDLSTSSRYRLSSILLLPSHIFGYVVGNLSGLRELFLDGVNISSTVPVSLAGLANLTSLHLSFCKLSGELTGKIFQLRNLDSLDLSNNPLLTGTLPKFPLDNRLRILLLSGTKFSGVLPNSFGNLKFLQRLQFKGCNFSGQIPSSLFGITQLVHLDISSNNFSGEIPSLENVSQLVHLDLSSNRFSGRIPLLGSLKNVVEIDLSSNNLSGAISSSSFQAGLLNLTKLDLHNNSLNGTIPSALFTSPSLQKLDLSHNQFDTKLDEFGDASSSLLNSVDLSNNKLQGPIPKSIFQLKSLKVLTLSSNNFSGTIDISMLQNLMNLLSLDLSDNSLAINTSYNNTTFFPHFGSLKLRSCNLTKFPDFLRNQPKLLNLDLSNNKIEGEMPSWIWKIGNGYLNYLNLSNNMVSSLEQPNVALSSTKLTVLDLHANRLQGSMPIPPPSIVILDYSHNNFTSVIPTFYLNSTIFFSLSGNKISGEIPSSICYAFYLIVLDLSSNKLSGSIPRCFDQLGNLRVLNLGKNHFHSAIPERFVDGCSLGTLNLNGNILEGSLPKSLANCTKLEVLNIGNNRINDSFPSWLGSLQHLRVLILRSNKFYGPIGRLNDQNAFSQLQVIDLSSNGFTGNLASQNFQNMKAMMADEDEPKLHHKNLRFRFLELNPFYYQDTVTITLKGLELEFLNILTIFTSIDLSNNSFQGDIPKEIGNLTSLYALNMSHNEFTGPIPSSFEKLRQLESLDLSVNQLSGVIPTELTALTFLSVFNLSQNNFTGSIPQAKQFLTFSNDSFQDNPGLCGPPLSRKCKAPSTPRSADSRDRNEFNWHFIWVGMGFGGGIGMIFGPLVFWGTGRRWYYKHVDKMLFMVIPAGAWYLIDCYGGKIEEERVEQELIEFSSDIEDKPCGQRFCVFCTQVDKGWEKAIHRECSCPDASQLFSSEAKPLQKKTVH